MAKNNKHPLEIFFSKILFVENKCWEWMASKDHSGYGRFHVNRKSTSAHSVSYELFNGRKPIGLHIDHLCRNRGCVNPDHLEAVTMKENILRGVSPAAINKKRTVCKNGHTFTEENTYRFKLKNGSTGRACKECGRISVRKRRANERRAISSS